MWALEVPREAQGVFVLVPHTVALEVLALSEVGQDLHTVGRQAQEVDRVALLVTEVDQEVQQVLVNLVG